MHLRPCPTQRPCPPPLSQHWERGGAKCLRAFSRQPTRGGVRAERAPEGGFSPFSPGVQPRAIAHDPASPFPNGRSARPCALFSSRMNPPAEQEPSLRDGDTSTRRPSRAPKGRSLFSGPIYWAAYLLNRQSLIVTPYSTDPSAAETLPTLVRQSRALIQTSTPPPTSS